MDKLFVGALSSLCMTWDYAEYLLNQRSFIAQKDCSLGFPEEDGVSFLKMIREQEMARLLRYLGEIDKKGLSDEFDRWFNQDEVFEGRMQDIFNALELGSASLTIPSPSTSNAKGL